MLDAGIPYGFPQLIDASRSKRTVSVRLLLATHFEDNDAFNEFLSFISKENPKRSELEPEPTMKGIEGRAKRILVQVLQREKAKR